MRYQNRRGQVTVETAVMFTFVVAAFVFMGFYLQRAAQGGVKSNADSLGQQFSLQEGYRSFSRSLSRENQTASDSIQCSRASQGMGGAAPSLDPHTVNTGTCDPATTAPALAAPGS
jgi:hypothetical protein